jgi:hypothetical protein
MASQLLYAFHALHGALYGCGTGGFAFHKFIQKKGLQVIKSLSNINFFKNSLQESGLRILKPSIQKEPCVSSPFHC